MCDTNVLVQWLAQRSLLVCWLDSLVEGDIIFNRVPWIGEAIAWSEFARINNIGVDFTCARVSWADAPYRQGTAVTRRRGRYYYRNLHGYVVHIGDDSRSIPTIEDCCTPASFNHVWINETSTVCDEAWNSLDAVCDGIDLGDGVFTYIDDEGNRCLGGLYE